MTNAQQCVERKGIVYAVNSEIPFTGLWKTELRNEDKKKYADVETNYKNGLKDGIEVTQYDVGKQEEFDVKGTMPYKKGLKDGLAEVYYSNGQKQSETNWVNDKKEGLSVSWHKNGQKASETNYVNDEKKGLVEWNEDGEKLLTLFDRIQKDWFVYAFCIASVIIFLIYSNYVSNEVTKITEQAPTKQAPTKQAPTKQAPTKQAPTKQAPTKQAPTSPSPQVEINYSNLLAAHIAKHLKYPRIAQRREMQGQVVIAIQIGGDGSLISKNIQKSSGHEILDKEAMNIVERSKPFPLPPYGKKNSYEVPIIFSLR